MYPGTLTCYGTVPNIELVRQASQLAIPQGISAGARLTHSSYTGFIAIRFTKAVSRGFGQMLMRSLETNVRRCRHRTSGFSLIEMTMVVALTIVVAVISVISLVPLMSAQHVVNAYNTTLSAMRQARDNAVSQRTSYSVTFSNATVPNTITVAPTLTGFQGTQNSTTYTLPTDVLFLAQSVVGSTPPPDGFGSGANAIDFGYTANGGAGGAATFYFCPDGSAQDAEDGAGNCSGSLDNGVVYLSQSGNVLSSRAVDLWGGTGRVRGWRLYGKTGGGYQWLRQ